MNYSLIKLYKIIYCPITKKYKIIFNTTDKKFKFSILLNNNYAKNIAMASENISSIAPKIAEPGNRYLCFGPINNLTK